MSSILNAFSSTTRFTSRSQIGEAIMNNGTVGTATPNVDTTIGVAQQATVRSKEGWLGNQYSVALDNNQQVKGNNLSAGSQIDNRMPAYAVRDRQLTSVFIEQESAEKNGANFSTHPVWSGISLVSDNAVTNDGILHNINIGDYATPFRKGSASLNAYLTVRNYSESAQPRNVILSLGAAWVKPTVR
jgi:hypothetical protein